MKSLNECAPVSIEEERLRADIALFETHLAQIGANDDSAYEKARIRTYELLLQERRTRLRLLLAARTPS